MNRTLPLFAFLGATALIGSLAGCQPAPEQQQAAASGAQEVKCDNDAGLSLAPGFCATVYADNIGHGRQMAMSQDGTLYVNVWNNRVLQGEPAPDAGFIVALRDEDGDGKAEKVERFGTTLGGGSAGGTGIAIWKDGLYVEQDDKVVRYTLAPGEMVPKGDPAVVISGLPMEGDHAMKPFVIDADGNLFLNVGSASNVCEKVNRQPGSLGKDPCDELPTRAGIWKYRADKTGQAFSPKERYATGIRNSGSIVFDNAGNMFAMQHGRDQLGQNWPKLYTVEQGVEQPAEELISVKQGDDFGWPYCYYDVLQKKLVLAPEYGGDGGKAVGRCAGKKGALAAYPAHYAPTGLAYYPGGTFPAGYDGGLFIAFHGSWNRAPAPQDGYRVVFQPMANGQPSGESLLFADGFSGPDKGAGRPANRPTGLLVGRDALFVSDDAGGRIWKIVYMGPPDEPLSAAKPAPVNDTATPEASRGPAPQGFTAEQVALGERIYRGIERSGTCLGCHGPDGKGTTIGPPLTGPDWLWADGSIPSIAKVIREGVAEPKKFPSGMPALGGAPLSDSDVDAVAAYVSTLSQKK